jgi:hypothetical protein
VANGSCDVKILEIRFESRRTIHEKTGFLRLGFQNHIISVFTTEEKNRSREPEEIKKKKNKKTRNKDTRNRIEILKEKSRRDFIQNLNPYLLVIHSGKMGDSERIPRAGILSLLGGSLAR